MNNYVFLIIFAILVLILTFFKPQIKGWLGEKTVSTILLCLNKEEYFPIHDVMLKTENGSTQIDHVIVSIYGVFVIETKNYKGWITGVEDSTEWTKNMYGKKYKFKNPLFQNYGHVKALQVLLELSEEYFIPIVVFSVDADIKVKTNKSVTYTTKLLDEIRKYNEIKLTAEQVNAIKQKILDSNINSREAKKEHVNNIKTQIKEKHEKLDNRICPRCGSNLVERSGKYGKFLGCSNYPKCRYTMKL